MEDSVYRTAPFYLYQRLRRTSWAFGCGGSFQWLFLLLLWSDYNKGVGFMVDSLVLGEI